MIINERILENIDSDKASGIKAIKVHPQGSLYRVVFLTQIHYFILVFNLERISETNSPHLELKFPNFLANFYNNTAFP